MSTKNRRKQNRLAEGLATHGTAADDANASTTTNSSIIFYGIVAIVFFIPLLFTPVTAEITQIKTTVFQFIILLLSVLWAIFLIRRGELRLSIKKISPISYALIFFFFLLIVSYLFSPYKYASFEELMRYLSYFALYFLVTRHVFKESQVKILLYAMIITTAIITVYGLCQRLGYDFALWDIQGRIFSTFGHPNFFANYLIIIIPTFVGVFIAEATQRMEGSSTKKRHIKLLFLLILIILAVLCLLFTLSRGAFLGLAMAFPLFAILVVFYLRSQIKAQKFWLCALSITIFISIALVVVFDSALKSRAASSVELKTEVTGSNEARLVIWKGSMKMFQAKPVFGHGLGTFQLFFPQFRPSDYARKGVSHNTLHAHSEYLEIATEMGSIGLIAFLCLLFCYFFISIFQLKRLKGDYYAPIVIGLLSGVFAALTHNMLSVSMRWTAPAVPFWFAFAFTVALVRVGLAQKHREPTNNVKSLGTLGRGAMNYRFADSLRSSRSKAFRKITAYFLLMLIGLSLLLLISCDFISDIYLAKTEAYLANKQWEAAAKTAFLSRKFHPYKLEAYYKLAYSYNRLGGPDAAITTLKKLSQLAPNFAQIHYNFAGAYEALKQYSKAIPFAKKAVAQNDSATTHFLLATLYTKKTKWEKAIEEYKRVRELNESLLLKKRMENPYLSLRFRKESAEQYEKVRQAEINALLSLGKANEELKQFNQAKEYYSFFLKEYPRLAQTKLAKKRLDKIVTSREASSANRPADGAESRP